MRRSWALVAVVGCTEPPQASPQSWFEAELVLPAAAADAPAWPGPAPRRRTFDAARTNEACAGCHAAIAAEWETSLHRRAHTDAAYQTQFAEEPFPFCTGCHAPEADPAGPVPPALSHMGVGCVTCHVVGNSILAVPGTRASDGRHHRLTRAAEFGTEAACAACHEFGFPPGVRTTPGLKMQSTIAEHAASPFAETSCASCHMPWVDGHRSHRFDVAEDFVRQAAVVEVSLRDGAVIFRLEPAHVGHAFPTGDLLRRIALTTEVVDPSGNMVDRDVRWLTRHFTLRRRPHQGPLRGLVRDDRVGVGGAVEHEHRLRRAPVGGEVRYRVRYERVHDPLAPESEGVVLAEGRFRLR